MEQGLVGQTDEAAAVLNPALLQSDARPIRALVRNVVGRQRQQAAEPLKNGHSMPTGDLLPDVWVLLGASNLTRALPQILALTRQVDVYSQVRPAAQYLIAAGHGRSYGVYSRVLGRGLGSILESGLWPALQRAPRQSRKRALITDIGNDIAYGQPVDRIVTWVDECISRLRVHDTSVVMTELPIASLQTLTPRRYQWLRALFFPSSRLSLDETLAAAVKLNDLLRQLAVGHGLPIVTQPVHWFGWDPVHIRRNVLLAACRVILQPLLDTPHPDDVQSLQLLTRLRLQLTTAEIQDFLHWRWRRVQPAMRLTDGSAAAFY